MSRPCGAPILPRVVSSSLLLIAFLFATSTPAAAQAVYGSISGTITDNTGAILPGVTVTVTSNEPKTVVLPSSCPKKRMRCAIRRTPGR